MAICDETCKNVILRNIIGWCSCVAEYEQITIIKNTR